MPKPKEVACWCGRFSYPHRYAPECYRWLQDEAIHDAELRKVNDERSALSPDTNLSRVPGEWRT